MVVNPRSAPIADVLSGRAELDALDAGIRALLRQRIAVSKQVQALRRQSGEPGIQHGRENEVIARYVDELGDPGADIALAVLQLCRGRLG